jgi:hypothetical protein
LYQLLRLSLGSSEPATRANLQEAALTFFPLNCRNKFRA